MDDLQITLKNYRCFADDHPAQVQVGSGFTALVGPNNGGKSSFLRFFYEMRGLLSTVQGTSDFQEMCRGNPRGAPPLGVLDQAEIACDRNDREITVGLEVAPKDRPRIGVTLRADRLNPTNWIVRGPWTQHSITPSLNGTTIVYGNATLDGNQLFDTVKSFVNTMYVGPFRNAINQGAGSYYDIQVGTDFVKLWNQWKAGSTKALNRRMQDVTEDIGRVFEFNKLEINAAEGSTTLQVNVDDRPYKLAEHGAGLAQFIVVLANAAIRQPDYILIDEPELNLHPTLQVDFLTRLASYSKRGVIFATHSLGLARAVGDRVYSFQRAGSSSVVRKFEQTPNYAEFLGELSFSSFKELGCETILLVEGATDVKTYQQFLRRWHKEHQVVVLPLGGDQLAKGGMEHELGELKRISNRIAAIVDSERPSADAPPSDVRLAFEAACKKLGFKVCLTERRAIENYLTDAAIKEVKGPKYRALGPYEKLETSSMSWGKHENWRIASRMKGSDIEQTDVGRFLAAL